ncbi:uncharacterized protein LOC108227183 isoform X2 [Daucus carota subsp. sativus]|uniref:uncharacterized protein LOC108227183 isoform X2 n=1 Tax=Daucus carota subsp. sativus TaxID=79200 RepID=UPI0030828DC0
MSFLSLLSPPRFSLITSQTTTTFAVHSSPSPPPPTSISLPTPPISDQSPPLSCALHCSHFNSCSGCTHEFNLHRPAIVDEASVFFKNFGVKDFSFDTCRLWGWRCRAKLAVRGSASDPVIGLYEEGTHNVVDIPDCKAHHPNINAAVDLLRKGMVEFKIHPYDEDQGTGLLRYVQMAVTTYNTSLPASERYRNGKVQLSLVWNSRNENSPFSDRLDALAKIIFGNRWRHLLGERDLWEHVGGIDVSMAPSSFGQANTRAFDSLLRKLHKYVPYGTSVADLYAGAGVIGLSLAAARKCRSVKCVEVNKESKLSFEKTAERLPVSVDSSISWHHADTSIEPLTWLVGADVVVVDPPRKGLDPSLVNLLRNISSVERKVNISGSPVAKVKDEKRPWVIRSKEASLQIRSQTVHEESQALPRTLIYISCGWESFKEDCKMLLSSKAWHLDKAHGFNFFPGTQSIEVLAVFKRGPGVGNKKKKPGKKKKKKTTLKNI